ncbi:putative olfactory receptor 2T2-like [Triplophysa rosa]|uniref:Olfactory receptor 2T2-like n=1 Tax=Triplophysa rosa TaxID=992332 RepID=A0A9W8C7H6_TRIRA|nr:putative olfactory receptor 2T2-like [Triplophysa rosa]
MLVVTRTQGLLPCMRAFIVTVFFTCLIIVVVQNSSELRENPRYALLCLHCMCVSGFNIMGAVVHSLRSLCWPVSRIVCWILFDLQVVMARGLMITLMLMSVTTCLSICLPLHYPALVQSYRHWVTLPSCAFALFNPVVFTVLACVRYPWDYVIGLDTECSTALEGTACIVSALTQLSVLRYDDYVHHVAIYLEGRRVGHFTPSNGKGCCTILIHCLESLAVTLPLYIVFCSAQSLSPVVFGLCFKELSMKMPHLLPCTQGICGYIGSTDNRSFGTVTSAGTGACIEMNASACVATGTLFAVISKYEEEQKETSDVTEVTV